MIVVVVWSIDGFVRWREANVPLTERQRLLLAHEVSGDPREIEKAHRARAHVCIDTASAYLPGWSHSSDAVARIEAECALREEASAGIPSSAPAGKYAALFDGPADYAAAKAEVEADVACAKRRIAAKKKPGLPGAVQLSDEELAGAAISDAPKQPPQN